MNFPIFSFLSILIEILSKFSKILNQITRFKWYRSEKKITKEESKYAEKIVRDGDIEKINSIFK